MEGLMRQRLFAGLCVAAVAAVSSAAPALAQTYPTKPVRMIIPFPPGGINDTVGRTIASKLSERNGVQFIVENRTGAGGVIGTEFVANAPKDGYTLLVASFAHSVIPFMFKLPYDAHKAFAPIAIAVSSPSVLAVHPGLPAGSIKELIALAKSKPGQLLYASGGIGGNLHLGAELFKLTAGVNLQHVPFRGAGPALIDVIGGHSQVIIATVTSIAPHARTGKLKALGVAGPRRSPTLPDVPTMEEAGLPGFQTGNWIGFMAPSGTPDAIVEKLHRDIAAVLDEPDVKARFADAGADIVRMSASEFGTFFNAELSKWQRVVKEAGIPVQ
jgi:tripartite-type tricarboxylate transporter receptor subunit TctC